MGRRPLAVEKITPVKVIAETLTLPDFNSGELTALQDLDTDVSLSEDSEYIPESDDTDDESNDPNETCDAAGANKENNNHDTTQGKKWSRRRLQYKETWLRNKRKVMRSTGKLYTN